MPTRTRSNTTKKTPPRWRIRVIEIDDPALPRRDAGQPNLTVDVTSTDPSTWDTWAERRSVDGARRIVRHDLSSRGSHANRDTAKKAEVATKRRLAGRGFTVNGDLTVYSLYVIELDASHIPEHRRPAGFQGYVYVGYTAKDPVERVEQHRTGTRSAGNNRGYSAEAHRLFVRHRPGLAPRQKYFDVEQALLAESRLRVRLEGRGYKVTGGQERLDAVRPEPR